MRRRHQASAAARPSEELSCRSAWDAAIRGLSSWKALNTQGIRPSEGLTCGRLKGQETGFPQLMRIRLIHVILRISSEEKKGNHQLISQEDTNEIKFEILDWGADLVGVADTEHLNELKVNPPDLLQGFARAVSIAIQLPISVFEEISDRPTPDYLSAYKTANLILDRLAYKTALALQKEGYGSLPIPASQVLDHENWYAAISHKAVARMAGLGWQGKNLLLITPQFGSRVRLVTVLTEAPLMADAPVKNRCGTCMLCRDSCPAHAIKGVGTIDHYKDRDEALHFSRCVNKLTIEYAALPGIDASICGICIKVCPFGRKKKKGNKRKVTF